MMFPLLRNTFGREAQCLAPPGNTCIPCEKGNKLPFSPSCDVAKSWNRRKEEARDLTSV